MKAVVVHAANDLRVDDLPNPVAREGEVLVAMEWGGICGSDISYWRNGSSGTAVLKHPLVLGHEVAGHIAGIGPGVGGLSVGQPVTVHPATASGGYFGSAASDPHTDGGFSELRVVRAEQIRMLPSNVDTEHGALAEPLAVAMHAVNRARDVRGRNVLVNGAGPIGSLVVAAAKHAGAATVTAADVDDAPLKIAQAMGADDVINVGAGNLPGTAVAASLGDLVTREITWLGSYRFVDEITDAVAAMGNGLDVTPLITHCYPINEAAQAITVAADRNSGSGKVLLQLGAG
ncbi:MAG: alcohol dehydrogenase catalytic domain-containing protein [Mycobacterium sp.]|nr:alcohol dehydrogenase catalytic domain-containing protein [Mycobacterium sp.]